jgi:uncharacterized membrane protein YqjE
MAAKNEQPNFILLVIELVANYMQRIQYLVNLAALEAQLAVKTLVVITALIFILSSVITVSWLSILALLFFYLVSIQYSWLTACAIIVMVNVLALATIFFVIHKIKRNLFFPSTREQLTHARLTAEN